MKSFFRRPALLLALLAGVALAACGGKAMFTVGGSISNLYYPGLVLTDGSKTLPVAANATSFAFPSGIEYGSTYNVVVSTQPAHEVCSVGNPTDTAGRMAAIAIVVSCGLQAYTVGGTVTGLTSGSLVLINGTNGGSVSVSPSTTADLPVFTFPAVTYGVAYGISVLTQPDGLNCSVVSKGTGVMGDTAVVDVGVSCVPKGLGG